MLGSLAACVAQPQVGIGVRRRIAARDAGLPKVPDDGTDPNDPGDPGAGDPGTASDGDGGLSNPTPDPTGGNDPTATPAVAMTWTQIYGLYFGPGSLGNCSASATCHQSNIAGFFCGTNKASCYNGLVGAGLITMPNPQTSSIGASTSILAWFGQGNMPPGAGANAQAAADIRAWVMAGAMNN
jgi:hypothetical protein